jgi:hypothetical protein
MHPIPGPARPSLIAAFVALGAALALPAAATPTFTQGSLFFASNTTSRTIYDISGGGNFAGETPFATNAGINLGQMAWSQDLTTMYETSWGTGQIYRVDASGNASVYMNQSNALGIVMTQDGRLLVAVRGGTSSVLDITDPLHPTVFATVAGSVRNMVQLADGRIMIVGGNGTSKVWDITAGGSGTVFANLPGSEADDIDYTSDGRIYVSVWTGANTGVYEVSAGGTFTVADRFANIAAGGWALAIDRRTDQILHAAIGQNYVWDITAGGNFSSTPSGAWAYNIPTTSDTAMDFVPFAELAAPVPAPASALSLLAGIGALAFMRRRAHRSPL